MDGIGHGAPASPLLTMMTGSLEPMTNSYRIGFIVCFIKWSIDPVSWQSTWQRAWETGVEGYSQMYHGWNGERKYNKMKYKMSANAGNKIISSEVTSTIDHPPTQLCKLHLLNRFLFHEETSGHFKKFRRLTHQLDLFGFSWLLRLLYVRPFENNAITAWNHLHISRSWY